MPKQTGHKTMPKQTEQERVRVSDFTITHLTLLYSKTKISNFGKSWCRAGRRKREGSNRKWECISMWLRNLIIGSLFPACRHSHKKSSNPGWFINTGGNGLSDSVDRHYVLWDLTSSIDWFLFKLNNFKTFAIYLIVWLNYLSNHWLNFKDEMKRGWRLQLKLFK